MLTNLEILNFQKKIRNDPVWFVENVLNAKIWDREKEILLSVKDNHETAVRSCNSSGKTYTAATVVHWWLLSWADAIVITTAPTGRQVKEILWREIRKACAGKHLYPSKAVLQTQIDLGERWFALGLSTDEPDKFQGYHSPHLLVVVDEASGVTEETYQAIDGLRPTKILLIGNPMRNSGRFADDFKRTDVSKIRISAFDTPNIKENKIIIPGLVSTEDVERMKSRYGEDSDVYRIRVLGEFPKQEADSLFSVDEIQAAIERQAEIQSQFEKKMGVDVARYGDDRTVFTIRQMEKITRRETYSKRDTMEVAGLVLKIAREEHIKAENINIDVIGLGAGVVDRLKEQGWNVNAVNVAEAANDNEHYANKRAELYNEVKDWIATADILDDEYFELANVKYKFNSRGQMLLESKEDMKKRGLPSPDVGDSLMLTFAGASRFIMPLATPALKPYYTDIGL